MTAVLEYAQRPALQSVCEATGASFYNEGYFSLKGVDYYPECDRERLTAVAGRLYDYIIMDFGNYADADQILFNKCDVRIIISGSKPWELANLEEVFRSQEEEVLKKYHFASWGPPIIDFRRKLLSIWSLWKIYIFWNTMRILLLVIISRKDLKFYEIIWNQ